MTFSKLILGAILVTAIAGVLVWKENGPDRTVNKSSENTALLDVTVEGLIFASMPQDLAIVMQQVDNGNIPGYQTIVNVRTLETKAVDNPEILLALSWLQAKVVESGVYIDDLQKDYDIGNDYYMRYVNMAGPEYPDSLLPIAEKYDELQMRLERFKQNPL